MERGGRRSVMRAHLSDRAALGAIIEAAERCIRLAEEFSEKEELLRVAIRRLTEALELAVDPVNRHEAHA